MTIDLYPDVLFALCIWREARSQSQEARRGVAHVIMNRAQGGDLPGGLNLVKVILRPYQFSSFNYGDPNATKLPQPNMAADWTAWLECCQLVDNPGDDPTGGAVFYESFDPSKLDLIRARDPWFAADKLTIQIDAVRFYHA